MKYFFLCSVILITALYTYPQKNDKSWKVYDDSRAARIDITIAPERLNWILAHPQSDSVHPASMHFTNNLIDEALDSIGFRIRGNTSRDSQKKSFKISFNEFIPGKEFYDLDKMNLNGEHNDPSIVRSKLSFDLMRDVGLTASRASYAALYINDKYYGLYISVEHIDDEFLDKNFADDTGNLWKCLYPADLVYKGSDPGLYKEISGGRRTYDLQTNKGIDDYTELANLIKVLNLTPSNLISDSLEKYIDVPGVLKYFAMNVLIGSWDDYRSLRNNYYLYHIPSEDKFRLIPYDYDNTFGIDWFNVDWANANPYNFPQVNQGPRPLAAKLMADTRYRSMYTHFLKFYMENVFKLSIWENRIDSLHNLITPFVMQDTFRTKDYNFTMDDFNQSFAASNYSNEHVKRGIKQFVNFRYNSLSTQLTDINSDPVVYALDWSPKIPAADDSIYVTISAYDFSGINEASIEFTHNGSVSPVNYPMRFNPVPQTKLVEEADRWVGVIPPLGKGNSGTFKIVIQDNDNVHAVYPKNNSVSISTPAPADGLMINEFLASNSSNAVDSAGDHEDWIELFNSSSEDILLSGMYLTDKPDNLTKWQFPGTDIRIAPGEFLLIWCDEEQEEGDLHTNFKLSIEGEFIAVTSADGVTVIDSITFGSQATDISYGRYPDGAAEWQAFNTPTPGVSNVITSLDDDITPLDFSITAYPNPFNPSTTLDFTVSKSSFVNINVYDILGNKVASLINEDMQPGEYTTSFNASGLSSGIYFCRLEVHNPSGSLNFNSVKKLVLMK